MFVNSLCLCFSCAQAYVLSILGLFDIVLKFAQVIKREINLETIMSGSRGGISMHVTICVKALAHCLPGKYENPYRITLARVLYDVYV